MLNYEGRTSFGNIGFQVCSSHTQAHGLITHWPLMHIFGVSGCVNGGFTVVLVVLAPKSAILGCVVILGLKLLGVMLVA